jgi:hypothetical protein
LLVLLDRAPECLPDRLERSGVVPVAVVAVLVFEDRRRHLVDGLGRGHVDDGLGLGPDDDVLFLRGSCGRRSFFRVIPVDVFDRGEELVEILEQVVALTLVVGH